MLQILPFNIHNYTVLSKSGNITVFRHYKGSNKGFHHGLEAKSGKLTTFRHYNISHLQDVRKCSLQNMFLWNMIV